MTDKNESSREEELVREDDSIIGTAFKWSLVVIFLIATVIATVLLAG